MLRSGYLSASLAENNDDNRGKEKPQQRWSNSRVVEELFIDLFSLGGRQQHGPPCYDKGP